MDLPSDQMLKLYYEEWGQCFLKNLNDLRHSESMCDAKIILKDGISLLAHSCVLAAVSPLFKALLDDKEYPEIDMAEFPPELIKQVLEFIYTGEILVSRDEVDVLYSVAQSLNIPVLSNIIRGICFSLNINVDDQVVSTPSQTDTADCEGQQIPVKRPRGRPRKIKEEMPDKRQEQSEDESFDMESSPSRALKQEDSTKVFNSVINLQSIVVENDSEGITNQVQSWDYFHDLRPVNKRKEWKSLKNPIKIEDVKVPADGSVPDRAEKTLPPGLMLATSTTGNKSLRGVFAVHHLKKGATFGPYEGEIRTNLEGSDDTSYCWKIYKNCKLLHWVDGHDESKANWMRFVRHAGSTQEQNIEAFQHDGSLYFRSIRDIMPEQELLVRYGNQYSAKLAAEQTSDVDVPIDGYTCTSCDKMYATDIMYWKHMRSVHGKPMPVEIYNKIQEERMKNLEDKKKAKITVTCDDDSSEEKKTSEVKESSEDTVVTPPAPAEKKDGPVRKRRRGRPRKYASLDYGGSGGYECSVCQRVFKTPAILRQHSAIHSSDKPYKCDLCGKAFTQRGNLRMHAMAHTGERPFVCNICGKDFNRRGELKKHIIRHQGHRPFKCTVCGKGFGDWGNLHRHKKIHTGEKPFKCHICGKTFSQTSNLRTHIKRHTGEKPHKCHMCEKCFGDLGHLRTHLRRHTGEKPFVCSFCGKGFVDKQSMRKHSDRHINKPNLIICPNDQVIFPSKNVITPLVITASQNSVDT